jgi:hypothetical protein
MSNKQQYKIQERITSYHFLKKDFQSAYNNNGHNIDLALSQVSNLRNLDKEFIRNILYLYINKLQYKKWCPNCNMEWNGIECKFCSFDTGFDPNWD